MVKEKTYYKKMKIGLCQRQYKKAKIKMLIINNKIFKEMTSNIINLRVGCKQNKTHKPPNEQSKQTNMSDIILKFWPKEVVTESKVETLKKQLIENNVIGEETEFWGKSAFKSGEKFNTFFEPLLSFPNPYIEDLAITISDKDYGVIEGEEDFEYIDRLNVISIFGGDATFEKWNKLIDLLTQITGNEYQGGYELL